MKRTLIAVAMIMAVLWLSAGKPDKSKLDALVWEQLNGAVIVPNPKPATVESLGGELTATQEDSIMLLRRDSYGTRSVRNDVYVSRQPNGTMHILDDGRYPVERLNNLMLGVINADDIEVFITHHSYDGKLNYCQQSLAKVMTVMCDRVAYCSITGADALDLKCVAVFVDVRYNNIHMMEVTAPQQVIAQGKGVIFAELYTFIPQDNIKN